MYSIIYLDDGKFDQLELMILMEGVVKHCVKFLVEAGASIFVLGSEEDVICFNCKDGNLVVLGKTVRYNCMRYCGSFTLC